MFDNVFDKVMPSKVTRCGWPWHGLVRSDEDGSLQVELPNETVIPLKATLRNPRGGIFPEMFSQEGTVFKFKDPRAPEIPAEEAATAGGLEWRSEYLFNPNQQVIYGDNSGLQQRGWLYHENGNNWKVTIYDSTRLRFVNAQVGGIQKVEYRSVTGDTANIPWLQVIDAVPDGSRVLLAHINGRSENEPNEFDYVFDNASFLQDQVGAWWSHPIAYFELTLTGLNPVIRRLKSYDDIKGTVTSTESYIKPQKYITSVFSGYNEYPLDRGAITETTKIGGGYGPEIYFESTYRRIVSGALCGLFYRPDGTVGEITSDYIKYEEYEREPLYSLLVTLTHAFSESEMTGPTSFRGPDNYISTSAWFKSHLSTKQVIHVDGVEQSSLECTEDVNVTLPVNAVYRMIALGPGGPAGSWETTIRMEGGSGSVTGPVKARYLVDGNVVHENTRQLEIKASAGSGFSNIGASSRQLYRNVFNVVRYSPSMFACSVVSSNPEDMADKDFIVGSVVVPNAGAFPGYIIKQPPFGGLYGSYNPITHEVARDALTPVFWI